MTAAISYFEKDSYNIGYYRRLSMNTDKAIPSIYTATQYQVPGATDIL